MHNILLLYIVMKLCYLIALDISTLVPALSDLKNYISENIFP